MTYKLAKKLKDAGFPQKLTRGNSDAYLPGKEGIQTVIEILKEDSEYIKIPSLSELIEACGDRFMSLESQMNESGEWKAKCTTMFRDGIALHDNFVYGATPSEAVSNLWLELNRSRKKQ